MNEKATAATFPPTTERRERAIVLVHGAWVGEWCWEPLVPLLESSGRRVVPVSLTGHGLRADEAGPHITLDDHVRDVVAAMETFDLSKVTLVGHSYCGRVITRAWPSIAERVARLVYLDAHAPAGERPSSSPAQAPAAAAPTEMLPFAGFDPDPLEFGGDASVAWFHERTVPHSPATLQQDFWVDLPHEVDKTYVYATGDRDSRFAGYAAAAAASDAWNYHEVSGSHWVMVTHPERMAEIILAA